MRMRTCFRARVFVDRDSSISLASYALSVEQQWATGAGRRGGMATANGPVAKGEVYKVVLTGGPCAGKTTTLSRLRTFFEQLGWKVYTVPETATLLLGGGVKFEDLDFEAAMLFQQRILATLLEIERTYVELAARDKRNVLIVCDRGSMDPFAFLPRSDWYKMFDYVQSNAVELRDHRYDQVVHMVTAASGAESFYQLENNTTRNEGLDLARERDAKAAEVWVGHPYMDVVDNSTGFEQKIHRVMEKICERMRKRGLEQDTGDRLDPDSKKRKFLLRRLPNDKEFPTVQDFDVQHDYIKMTEDHNVQTRIRKRGQNGYYTYTMTQRKSTDGQKVDQIKPLTEEEYYRMYHNMRCSEHKSIKKTRKCFMWNRQYYQLDIFKEGTERCDGLLLLETYTTKTGSDLKLPNFLEVEREVTEDQDYSMFKLSLVLMTSSAS